LTKDDIEKMKKEASAHEAEDKKKREDIDMRNQADALAYSSEKTLKDAGDKISKDKKEKVEKSIKEVRDALAGTDAGKVKSAFDTLQKDIYEVAAEIYKEKGGSDSGPKAEADSKPEDGKTMDAEFKDKE